MQAPWQVHLYQELTNRFGNATEMSRVCSQKLSEAIRIQARVSAYKQLQEGREPTQTAGLVNNQNGRREYHNYSESGSSRPAGSLFLRPHVTDVLRLAKERFEPYVVTAAKFEHAVRFCNAFDSLDTVAKYGTWFQTPGRDHMGNWRLRTDQKTKRASPSALLAYTD